MTNSTILAYLDPGTGSMILQMVVGGLLGGLLVIKLMWKRIVGLFAGKKPESDAPSTTDDAEGASADKR
jgi:hypothetical protein